MPFHDNMLLNNNVHHFNAVEDCFNYIPTAKDWIDALQAEKKPMWMIRTLDLKVDD